MKDLRAQTAEEFGRALKALREARGVGLETIATKTKISSHTLHALEAGAFSRLPGQVFARMFLRQYLALLGEEPAPWVATFDVLWRKWESSSQPVPVVTVDEVKPRPGMRWAVGFVLVCAALAVVFWLHTRETQEGNVAPSTPQAVLQQLAPTPPPTPAPEAEASQEQSAGLVLETTRPCWVEWWPDGKVAFRQLLPAGQRLSVEVPERGGELVLGDAGAVSLRFREAALAPAGRDGQVVRLRVPWVAKEGEAKP